METYSVSSSVLKPRRLAPEPEFIMIQVESRNDTNTTRSALRGADNDTGIYIVVQ